MNLYIDGVGQKGYVRSGVSGQAGDTQGNPFPQLAIGEYKVITSNYKAEYDQISSAAITALTPLGHQRVRGRGLRHLHGRQLPRAARRPNSTRHEKAESESKEYGIAFGGPIIQDRMHFFVTYEAKRLRDSGDRGCRRQPRPPTSLAQLPADALAQLGPASIDFEEDLFFAKLDWALTDARSHAALRKDPR